MKINILYICVFFILCNLLFGSCTIIVTEMLRNNINLFDNMATGDTTDFFVPNKNNTDYAFTNIEDMLKKDTKEDSTFKEIDSMLKYGQRDSLGRIMKKDTLIDSIGKKIIRETFYSTDSNTSVKNHNGDTNIIIKYTNNATMIKSEVFYDTNNKFLEVKSTAFDSLGNGMAVGAKPTKILGIIPFVKDLNIDVLEYNEKNNDSNNSEYDIKVTNLDTRYYPDSIILNLTIQNKNGEFISGLAAPYLMKDKKQSDYWKLINENCKEINYTITEIKVEEIRDVTIQKNNICFVLDHSGSMGEDRCVNLQQAVYYVSKNTLNETDYLSAIKFTNRPIVEVEPTADKEMFRKLFKINGMGNYGEGGTNILRALDSSVSVLLRGPSDYNKIVVLFTDGESNMERLKEIMRKLISNKCKVFTICYGRVDMRAMKKIAKETFGRTYKIKDVRDFADAFKEIYSSLTNYYKVTYVPPQCADLHKININLELPTINNGNIVNKTYIATSEYDKSVLIDYAEVGTMTLLDIEFEYNKATIDSISIPKLIDIVNQLKRNESVNIQIAGHTDNIGADEYNQKLSLERANSVKKFLMQNGIDKNRIKTIGYGKSKPIVPNDTEENRHKNRRTEFIIIE